MHPTTFCAHRAVEPRKNAKIAVKEGPGKISGRTDWVQGIQSGRKGGGFRAAMTRCGVNPVRL